jgi:hypothetical protein
VRIDDHGQGALQVVAPAPGQIVATPAAQLVKEQFWVPASFDGQYRTQAEPCAQVLEHGPAVQVKSQLPPGPQLQLPLAHSPSHLVSASQLTWHGPLKQRKAQLEP